MKIKMFAILAAILLIIPPVSASDFETFHYLVENQDSARNKQLLKDLAYEYTGGDTPQHIYKLNKIMKDRAQKEGKITRNLMETISPITGTTVFI